MQWRKEHFNGERRILTDEGELEWRKKRCDGRIIEIEKGSLKWRKECFNWRRILKIEKERFNVERSSAMEEEAL